MTKSALQQPHNLQSFIARRAALIQQMQKAGGGIAIVPTAPEYKRNRDTDFTYRHDSYFYYLTGFTEPESVLVLVVGEKDTRSILFCRDKNIEREIWDGFRYGPNAAKNAFGFDEAFCISTLEETLPKLITEAPVLWYALGLQSAWDTRVVSALNAARDRAQSIHSNVQDIREVLDEMRLFKDPSEIAIIKKAANISARAFCRAMQATRPGMFEYELEAELLYEFRRSGSPSPAFPSIVAGGSNACVLHYVSNEEVLNDGELVLIDAGCERDSYASDISRTFPVNGKFSPAQKDLYQLVLAMQSAAIDKACPGQPYNVTHDAAVRVLVQGLVDLRLLTGSVEGLIESEAYTRFYMHRTGHWLGLDVHDVGDYRQNGQWRALQPGMVITIEPGCYIRAAEDIPREFWNIGIRIEDDLLITPKGHEVLTSAVPKTVADIEEIMGQRH